jgi:hypothetical protein
VLNQEKLFEFMPSRLTGFKSILRNLTIPKKHRWPMSPDEAARLTLRRSAQKQRMLTETMGG